VSSIPEQAGVYKITIGKRYYYGSTRGSLAERKNRHVYELSRNMHPNRRMQNSYNKYKVITFDALIVCDPDVARDYEQMFISEHFGKPECLNMKESAYGGANIENIDIKEAKRLYFDEKWTLTQIGDYFGGLSFSTIASRLTEVGCKLRHGREAYKVELPETIANDYKNNKSLREIATEHNVTHTVVRSRLIELGVDLREVGTPMDVTNDELKRMYVEEKMSSLAIGRKIGMSRAGVTKRLREALGKDIKSSRIKSTTFNELSEELQMAR